jgi:hypothetical protein
MCVGHTVRISACIRICGHRRGIVWTFLLHHWPEQSRHACISDDFHGVMVWTFVLAICILVSGHTGLDCLFV